MTMGEAAEPVVRYANHNGIRIAYRDSGGGVGPALVFVHGYRMHGGLWNNVVGALRPGQHRTVTVDLRGNGGSGRPPTDYGLPAFAGDVMAVITAANLSQPVLVGHSMGGTVVQYLMAELPQKLAGAVLVAPVPANGVDLPAEVVEIFRRSVYDEDVLRQLYAGSVVDGRLVVDQLVALSATASREASEQSLDTWRLADFADRLDGSSVPALVVAGAQDGLFSRDFLAQTLLPRLPGGRLTIAEGAGHFVPIEAPEVLAKLLEQFVAEIAPESLG